MNDFRQECTREDSLGVVVVVMEVRVAVETVATAEEVGRHWLTVMEQNE